MGARSTVAEMNATVQVRCQSTYNHMNEFKFSCPSCGQHIRLEAAFQGHEVECPSCKKAIVVPAPQPVKEAATSPTRPKVAAEPGPTTAPKAPEPKGPEAGPKAPEKKTPEASPQPVKPAEAAEDLLPAAPEARVAVLTPQIKLEIVQAVRARIADQSRWLPGKKEAGDYNYAGKLSGGAVVPVSPTDPEATHFSLFGAMMLEFHRRHVTTVTTGRKEFLDEELIQGIHNLLGRKPGEPPVTEADREALTHEQCLAVLQILERGYQKQADVQRKASTESRVEHIRLPDLLRKLDKEVVMHAEEVACALYHEVEELKRRLDHLESQLKK